MSSSEEPETEARSLSPPRKRVRRKRARSPLSSCVSMKSDRSMEPPLNFRGEFSGDQRVRRKRARSPLPSCVSMKSDRSMEPPLNFRGEFTGDQRVQEKRARSPLPSCVSMKSDRSMEPPLNFRGEFTGDQRARGKRARSPLPSCVSMKSDRSMEPPLNFRGEFTGDQRARGKRARSPLPSCVSMKSDRSMEPPLNFRGEFTGDQRARGKRARSPLPSCVSIKSDRSMEPPLNFRGEFTGHQRGSSSLESSCLQEWGPEKQASPKQQTYKSLVKQKQKDLTDSLERDEHHTKCIKIPQQALKTHLAKKSKSIFEGLAEQGHSTLLNEIYIGLYITEGGSGGVNYEHEISQIETASKRQTTQETAILCHDIFKPLPEQEEPRIVLTMGISGIGKTVYVQKFILDWAEGKANQDIDFIFTLPFRDLNMKKDREFSLMQLLQHYFPQLKEIKSVEGDGVKIVFIFDGLDECRLPLDFQSNEICCDITKPSSVDVLLTNLIQGNLLPSALLWITSRPAAANQIPTEFIHRVTEIRGFNDPQKEEYFRKRNRDPNQACRIISRIKSSRSLFIMCHIPVFCWISATVLEEMLDKTSEDLPRTLTEMYTHFLLIQTNVKNRKYHHTSETNPKKISVSDTEIILKLGQLAFLQLEKGNLIFYEEDLRESGIDVSEASVYSGVCTEIFKEECGLDQEKVYSFVHLIIQEYLAALFAFHSCVNENRNILRSEESKPHSDKVRLSDLHKTAVDQALESKNGHLDLFLRFLLGLSLDSTQILLRQLLTQTESRSESIQKTVQYIKKKIREETSAERTINLFHCLRELNDNSLVEEIQNSLRSGTLSDKLLKPHQCSALAFVLLMSEEILDEFDLKTYNTSAAGRQRLVPVVRNCRRAILNSCDLTERSCEIVASALQSSHSALRDLDLSYNDLGDSGVKLLCAGLMSPNCKLQTLGLNSCELTEKSCKIVASALQSIKNSSLRDLDLSYNDLGDSGVKLLCAGLMSPNCKLQTVRLGWCNLTEGCCDVLASVLRSPHSELRDLELRDNELHDSGVRALSAGLADPHCELQRLGLSGCGLTQTGCDSLASALCSNPSHLRELDLRYNHPGDSGARVLSAAKPDTPTVLVDNGGENRNKPGPRKYGCSLTLDPDTVHRVLSLSEGNRKVTHTPGREEPHPDHPERCERLYQVESSEILPERCYWEVEYSQSKSGGVRIAVAHKGISGKGGDRDSRFGDNESSWSLWLSRGAYSVMHNGKETCIPARPSPYHKTSVPFDRDVYKVGVCVDRPAGSLSFYSISDSETLTLLHRFHTHFTEHTSLCAGFYVQNSSVSFCKLG